MRGTTGSKSIIYILLWSLLLGSKNISFTFANPDDSSESIDVPEMSESASEPIDVPEITESSSEPTKWGNLRGLSNNNKNSYGYYGNNASNYANSNYNKDRSKYSYFNGSSSSSSSSSYNNGSSSSSSSYNNYNKNSNKSYSGYNSRKSGRGLPLFGKALIVMAIAFVAVLLIMLVFPALLAKKKGANDLDMNMYRRYNDAKDGKSHKKSKSKSSPKKNMSGNKTTKTAKTKKSSKPKSKSKKVHTYV